jgi:DMSO reductase family type II enzyme molybdopterin subunit
VDGSTSGRGPVTTESGYRGRFTWDRTAWGTHCVNCLSSCTYRVYATDGRVRFEEQAGVYPPTQAGVPDRNPMGCQKGSAWAQQAHAPDRLTHPMRRVGPRGSGEWERISWEDALEIVADAILDAIEESGPDAVLIDESAEGGIVGIGAHLRFAGALGAVSLDGIGSVNDFPAGHYLTFGHIVGNGTSDDSFHADTILIWHANPAYTRIPYYHYLPEARYRGAQVVLIAPDYSPSGLHCDTYVPVVPGSDSALALAMCRVVVEEGLVDESFVRAQTDLALLVRLDDGRLLRAADLAVECDHDPQYTFTHWDPDRGVVLAPFDTLELECVPALEGRFTATLADGNTVEVTPAYQLLVERLAGFGPEDVVDICGVHADTIRSLARRVASGRTKILEGFDTAKHYHGDLMERSMDLLLALTGNWGRQGAGLDTYTTFPFDGSYLGALKPGPGIEATEAALAMIRMMFGEADPETGVPPPLPRPGIWDFMTMASLGGSTAPPVFFWLNHCGYDSLWERADWADSPRPLREYLEQARDEWAPFIRPAPECPPRVLLQPGTNALRRTRGGQRMLLEHLWPQLSLVVSIDQRINTAGMYADILLPAAFETERVNLQYPIVHSLELAFADRVTEPAGEARSDWRIFCDLSDTIARQAVARGLGDRLVGRAAPRPLAEVGDTFHGAGRLRSEEALIDELVRDSALSGVFEPDTSLATLRRDGYAQVVGNGTMPMGRLLGGELRADETFSAFRWHVDAGMPYATTTGRATFYVDHPWFIEAGEQLPTHKDAPWSGGDHPLVLTGGHPRSSIHACNSTSPLMLATGRGSPTIVLHPADATARSIADHDLVEVFNDLGSFEVRARIAAGPRPGQAILYAGWEPYGFRAWQDATLVEAGMIKWLHLATGWGHLRFVPMMWQPAQFDRLTRIDVRRAGPPDPERHPGD